MRAMVFTEPGRVEMLDVPDPVVGPDEVLVDVAVSGICGSELHGIQTPGFRTPPLIMGHEFAGTTTDGRRVVINPMVSCTACDLCLRGLRYLCRSRSIVGIHRPGGFAQRVAVPRTNVVGLPDGLAWERAAAVEPIANAVHAWRLAGETNPERVGVIGAGTIGIVCLLVAQTRGATDVTVADVSEDRLAVAARLGATAASRLEGEYDVIFDAVGVPDTHADSVKRLRPGGTAVWLGLIGERAEFDSQHLVRMEKRVQGSFCYSDVDFRAAVGIAGRADVSWIQDFELEQGASIFMELAGGRTDVVKAVLRP